MKKIITICFNLLLIISLNTLFAQCYPNTEDCCDKISVEVEPDGTNPWDCCYYIYIKSEDTLGCLPSYFKAWDYDIFGNINSRIANEEYRFGTDGDERGRKFGPYCIKSYGRDSILIDLYFISGNDTTHCQKLAVAPESCPVKECCKNSNIKITKIPAYDFYRVCCFNLELIRDNSSACDSLSLQVWSATSNELLYETADTVSIPYDTSNYEICLDKDVFQGDSTISVIVKFVNKDGFLICSKTDTLVACSDDLETCTPDYPLTEWSASDTASFSFKCPGDTTQSCNVQYTYVYRHVKDGSGNSIHRDIQILNYVINGNCPCIGWIPNKIIENTWNKSNVISDFQILGDFEILGVGDTLCYNNFRVVTSGCGIYKLDETSPTGRRLYRRCNDSICCFQVYRTCYEKIRDFPTDSIIVASYTRIDTVLNTPQQCTPPCMSGNCPKWAPLDMSHYPPDIPVFIPKTASSDVEVWETLPVIKNNDCDISVMNDEGKNVIYVRLKCLERGKVTIQLYDLLGNEVFKSNNEKTSYSMSLPIETDLRPGVYFCTVKLNDNVFYEKFIIF